MPRMIIFLPDDDIITGTIVEDKPGVSKNLGTAVEWITKCCDSIIENKKDEMFQIQMGALNPSEPKLLWVKAIGRP